MSSELYNFLHPVDSNEEREVFISDRFRDKDGNPVLFKVRALSQDEAERMAKQCRKTKKVDGQRMEYVDELELSRRLVVAGTVFPDFAAKEVCDMAETIDPLIAVGRLLKAGEFKKLLSEISDFSGYGDLEEAVKN
nr:MAG TPA: tail assembly chaperone protein [Caudoviricetes sp.]DAK02312.1 MAG TPA: tail assembly chaperone protein [Caudoviricetes sp.]